MFLCTLFAPNIVIMDKLRVFVQKIVSVLADCDENMDLVDNDNILESFASSELCNALYVHIEKVEGRNSLVLSLYVSPLAIVAFVKFRNTKLLIDNLRSQIQILTLGSTSLGSTDMYCDGNLTAVQKRLRELELALDQCQQGTIIPDVLLTIPPILEGVLSACSTPPSAETLQSYLNTFNSAKFDQLMEELGISHLMGETAESQEVFSGVVMKSVRTWPAQLTQLSDFINASTFPSSIEKEFSFWIDLNRKVKEIKDQLNQPNILLTKLILKRTNRVSEQLIKEAEQGIDKATIILEDSVNFLRDFPIEDVANSENLHPMLSKATFVCIKHFTKLKHNKYEYKRSVKLFKCLELALYVRMIALLNQQDLMYCSLPQFLQIKKQSSEILSIWDENISVQKNIFKDVAKRRNEICLPVISNLLQGIQKRLNELFAFREQHNRLVNVCTQVLRGRENGILSDLSQSYQFVVDNAMSKRSHNSGMLLDQKEDGMVAQISGDNVNIGIFDTSPSGEVAWNSIINVYNKRLENVEETIIGMLSSRLDTAQTADEMFTIFSTFNSLFFRPSIRNAVNSFRTALVRNVHDDVKRLQDKFKQRYDNSLEKKSADLRDIPPLAGRIMWARQIENQLATRMQRMEDVLGAAWALHAEGKQLKHVCDELCSYLGTDSLYNEWLAQQLKSDVVKYRANKEFLFSIEQNPRSKMHYIRVNFDERLITVFREVTHLDWLLPTINVSKKSIPTTIRSMSTEANMRYPIAMMLQSALAMFHKSISKLSKLSELLLVAHIKAVRDIINEAFGGTKRSRRWIKWSIGAENLDKWATLLDAKCVSLQERVRDVNSKIQESNQLLKRLKECSYDRAELKSVIEGIQQLVDDMQIQGYTNIKVWVYQLDKQIEELLIQRLNRELSRWADSLKGSGVNAIFTADLCPVERSLHEMVISGKKICIFPPLMCARQVWLEAFHKNLGTITTLPRLISTRFEVFGYSATANYHNIFDMLNVHELEMPLLNLETFLLQAHDYSKLWLRYQIMWDISPTSIFDAIGPNISKLVKLLEEIQDSRNEMESKEESASFGFIIITHTNVQNKIIGKCDAFQRDAQEKLCSALLNNIIYNLESIANSKNALEDICLENNTEEIFTGVEHILKEQRSLDQRQRTINELEMAEKKLQNQQFDFPNNYKPVSSVMSLFYDMSKILERRETVMLSKLPELQKKISNESSSISKRIDEIHANWESSKPICGDLSPVHSISVLKEFEVNVKDLLKDLTRITAAKDALNIVSERDERIDCLVSIMDELLELIDVWQIVLPVWVKLNDLAKIVVNNAVPSEIRKDLETQLDTLRSIPLKFQAYAVVEEILERIKLLLSYQPVLTELCTIVLKDRHWRKLSKAFVLNRSSNLLESPSSGITVAALWNSDLLTNNSRKEIASVLSTAQGELAIERFLGELREKWFGFELSLAIRKSTLLNSVIDNLSNGSVPVIVGWDEIFVSLEDNLSSLASLKQSPYFSNVPEFQEDAKSWEARLLHARAILHLWVDVQNKWIYLQNIFQNSDIKAQLPAQFAKFNAIDREFIVLLKRIASKPTIMDLLAIENVLKQLERYESVMGFLQKALGEYLEKQRQVFPRFYFVNNDDLIEILGNSQEPKKIFPYLSKMFSALSGLHFLDETDIQNKAVAFLSKEGEVVHLSSPIDLNVSVGDWVCELEDQMAISLYDQLQISIEGITKLDEKLDELLTWIDQYPAQIIQLCIQILWCSSIEDAITENKGLEHVLNSLHTRLSALSEGILMDLSSFLRKKIERLITEFVHQRDVVRSLMSCTLMSVSDFEWLYHLRYYWSSSGVSEGPPGPKSLCIKMANAIFSYGFEYLGLGEILVQTPLTDRCYLTLTQALHSRMGANPFGPAGTGKTESVKMLGAQLGRFVLVFNCDSSFDYAAMGRIFAGLCQVGAWGCFDEFNRLEERILSAVSQQIASIQRGLLLEQDHIELLGNPCKLCSNVGIFVTLNPGYAGRSNIPDNLKQLFRTVAMVVPDRKLIAQVMLYSQGIVYAEELSGKVVHLFHLCHEQLSVQSHYDFGLRALKTVLIGAGALKRLTLSQLKNSKSAVVKDIEVRVLIRSSCDSIVPKLVPQDSAIFKNLLKTVFPDIESTDAKDSIDTFTSTMQTLCEEENLLCEDEWFAKVMQLNQVLEMRHGVMLVGASCTGKSTALQILFKAKCRIEKAKGKCHIIDPKTVSKIELFGHLNPHTLEWTDGIFTNLLRQIITDDDRNESECLGGHENKPFSWIVFDGDVDPEWAENLNSVLDDNKILTLPNGDRLRIPDSMRILMEVDSLKYATMATISRCGMIWFSENLLSMDTLITHHMNILRKSSYMRFDSSKTDLLPIHIETKTSCVDTLVPLLSDTSIVRAALLWTLKQNHVMVTYASRLLTTLNALLLRGISTLLNYNDSHQEIPILGYQLDSFVSKWLKYSAFWAFGSSLNIEKRLTLGKLLISSSDDDISDTLKECTLGDLQVCIKLCANGESTVVWEEWKKTVIGGIRPSQISKVNTVVNTVDTVRHEEVIKAWLFSRKPFIMCGPPGSGKTMTLTSVVENLPDCILAPLNFSSNSMPDLIIKTLAQFCEILDSPIGLIMQPNAKIYREEQWLILFCDEINLPERDFYGTQKIIMFLRQLVEQNGFWDENNRWICLRRIQIVGACNPPSDIGRVPLTPRFLRHCPLLYVDYPSESSIKEIYYHFNSKMLDTFPNLISLTWPLTNAMVAFYLSNQTRFKNGSQPQYVYSPRELSRWVRAMHEALSSLDNVSSEELIRLWGHEGLRLFHDRLVTEEEKEWCQNQLDNVANNYFSNVVDVITTLKRPILYSQWISNHYQSSSRETIKKIVTERMKVFCEEELHVPLVIFDDVLNHILRINNVLRNPMGHLLLSGDSGVGKTVLSRFVAWMNNMSVFQIKASKRYDLFQFDDDLRALLYRVGVKGERVCFIFDESNVLSTAFLERMNALLTSGEIPGLFEGKDRNELLAECRKAYGNTSLSREEEVKQEASGSRQELVDLEDCEIWRQFIKIVQCHLHVVFTMNPASADFNLRTTASPALFNRCVVDWFGTWQQSALAQVANDFTMHMDIAKYMNSYTPLLESEVMNLGSTGAVLTIISENLHHCIKSISMSTAIVAALVSFHNITKEFISSSSTGDKVFVNNTGLHHYLSPRDFLGLIRQFIEIEKEKRLTIEEVKGHLHQGLKRLAQTQEEVVTLRQEMVAKEVMLSTKDEEANTKLTQMMAKQKQAEERKTVVERLSKEMWSQNEVISSRKSEVEEELSDAEPALKAAKEFVQNIHKSQLDEVRALARPPKMIQLTLEMVAIMIGESKLEWSEIRKVIRREDFIPTVVKFDPLVLAPKQISLITSMYLDTSKSGMDYDSVDRASKACGPLFQWAQSQIHYASILRRIQPLREEVQNLQSKSEQLEIEQSMAMTEVEELQSSIAQYKKEYASAIREAELVRNEMNVVTKKMKRAESLLRSLHSEKIRWESSTERFDKQINTLLGDALLSAAFLNYAGCFDQNIRDQLSKKWIDVLESLHLPTQGKSLDLRLYLSSPSEQLQWHSFGLPADDLAEFNAILLQRYTRYPLIVDPAGQGTKFLLKKYQGLKITESSFLDESFLKTLTSAIRFGTPLLVHDAEFIDPILNPVLNREYQKIGGRTLIRLGNEDIDFSPTFFIILVTTNPNARFAPDLCSRVTIVNFTVTQSSLQNQALAAILRNDRPEIQDRSTHMLSILAEQSVKLRELEELLLSKIAEIEGAILDDDTVVDSLEKIKSEAAGLDEEVLKTKSVMEEIMEVSNTYTPLAANMAAIYFALGRFSLISSLYQYDLEFYLRLIQCVLDKSPAKEKFDSHDSTTLRIQLLATTFYTEIMRRMSPGLKNEDKLLLAARLAQLATKQDLPNISQLLSDPDRSDARKWGTRQLNTAEYKFLFENMFQCDNQSDENKYDHKFGFYRNELIIGYPAFDANTAQNLLILSQLVPELENLHQALSNESLNQKWKDFFHASGGCQAHNPILPPLDWLVPKEESGLFIHPERKALVALLLVKVLRPDRLIIALENYVAVVFGPEFRMKLQNDSSFQDIRNFIEYDSTASSPIIICSEPGHDYVLGKVTELAEENGRKIFDIAMGSPEGCTEAKKRILEAAKKGYWVLLRNVHLCSEWLKGLEKEVRTLCEVHDQFRLFLTADITHAEELPPVLIRKSEIIIAEAGKGIKTSVVRFLSLVPSSKKQKHSISGNKLYVLLAWLHSVLQERSRYTPVAWSKKYEFSENDAKFAIKVLDAWLEERNNCDHANDTGKIPWVALRTLLSQSVYGGQIDRFVDQNILESIIRDIFNADTYSGLTPLVIDTRTGEKILTLPDDLSLENLEVWLDALPNGNSPIFLGLSASAERQHQEELGRKCLSQLDYLQEPHDWNISTEQKYPEVAVLDKKVDLKRSNMLFLLETAKRWLAKMPTKLLEDHKIINTEEIIKNGSVMGRCLAIEILNSTRVQKVVQRDLNCLASTLSIDEKCPSSDLSDMFNVKELIDCISERKVPNFWNSLCTSVLGIDLETWISNMQVRGKSAEQNILPCLRNILALDESNYKNEGAHSPLGSDSTSIWLGGMHNPGSLITASKQHAALTYCWNVVDLELYIDFEGASKERKVAAEFEATNLKLEGAELKNMQIHVCDLTSVTLPSVRMVWRPTTKDKLKEGINDRLKVPVYLDNTRTIMVMEAFLPVPTGERMRDIFIQRGVCLVLR